MANKAPENKETPSNRKAQAKRLADFQQGQIADYIHQHATAPGNERPFRYHLTGGSQETPVHLRWRQPQAKAAAAVTNSGNNSVEVVEAETSNHLIADDVITPRRGPLSLLPRSVPPPVRLRRPKIELQKLGKQSAANSACYPSSSSSATPTAKARSASQGAASSLQPRPSPRQLPPIVYTSVHEALYTGRLPAAWFDDRPTVHREASPEEASSFLSPTSHDNSSADKQNTDSHGSLDGLSTKEGSGTAMLEHIDPPISARSSYLTRDGREWRPCEILAYDRTEQQYLIRWAFGHGLEKRVSAMQLLLDGETEADADQRRMEAMHRRDIAESNLCEGLVVEELSRWEVGVLNLKEPIASGSSMDRILSLAQPHRYKAEEQALSNLTQEVCDNYCRAQAKSVLLWRRTDLQQALVQRMWQPANGVEYSPSGVAIGSSPGSSDDFFASKKRLQGDILMGNPKRRDKLKALFDLCGSLSATDAHLLLVDRKREPYSLPQITRALADSSARWSSEFRITWPEQITQIFLHPSGTQWDERTSGLVARRMEVCLHDLCLRSLHWLVDTTTAYAEVSDAVRKKRLELTYVPPMVYQRTKPIEYERHPLFRIQVRVEFMNSSFEPSTELAVEAFFAAADTRTIGILTRRRATFEEVARQIRQKHRDALGVGFTHLPPDGGSGGGAPTAAATSIQKGIAQAAAKIAGEHIGDDEGTPSSHEDDEDHGRRHHHFSLAGQQSGEGGTVLFVDAAGELVVRLSAHPVAFEEVVSAHFRKVVELSEGLSRIDSYLQVDEEVVQQKTLQSLSSVHSEEVKRMEDELHSQILSCCFDGHEVVREVERYCCLLGRFAGQFTQLRALLHAPLIIEQLPTEEEQDPPGQETKGNAEGAAANPCLDDSLSRLETQRTSVDSEGNTLTSYDSQSDAEYKVRGSDQATPVEEIQFDERESEVVEDIDPDCQLTSGLVKSIPELNEHLEQIDSWFNELNECTELSERHLGLFLVDAAPLRRSLLAMCACCRLRLLGCMQRWLEEDCAELMRCLQDKNKEIIMLPKQADELQSTLEAVNGLDDFLKEKEPRLAKIREMFQVLERWSHQVPKHLMKRWYDCIHAVPDLRDRADKWRVVFRKDLRGRFNLKIADHAKHLEAQLLECKNTLDEFAAKVSLNKAEFYHAKLKHLQQRMKTIQEQVKKQHLHEEMMEMSLSEFPWLTSMVQQIVPLLELWYLAHEWIQWKDEILFGEFIRIDPEAVKAKLSSCTSTMRRLEDLFASQPRPRQVLHSLSLELTELRVLLPVIVSLRNPALRERHWQLIGEAIDQTIQFAQIKDLTLSTMNERFPFVAHLSKIQEISETAAKEMLIENELQLMQDQWAKLPIIVKQLTSGGTSTPSDQSGNDYTEDDDVTYYADFRHDEVWELIAEQMVLIKLMAQSPYAAVHSVELIKHDEKLKLIGELCDLLHESQYGYLCTREQLVSDGVVQDLLQKEGNREWRRWPDVHKHWQHIMLMLRSQPSWLALLEVSRVLENCREAGHQMDRINKAVHDVLDRRRLTVPFLYRLDDETLMRMLLHGHDPSIPGVRRCLPAVLALDTELEEDLGVYAIKGIVGETGEYVPLTPEVQTFDGLKVEEWIDMYVDSMRTTLRLMLQSVIDGGPSIKDECLMAENIPLQVRHAAVEVIESKELHDILEQGAQNSDKFLKRSGQCMQIIEELHTRHMKLKDPSSAKDQDEATETSSSESSEEVDDDDDAESDKENSEEEKGDDDDEEEEDDEEEDEEEEKEEEEEEISSDSSGLLDYFAFEAGLDMSKIMDPQKQKLYSERRARACAGVLKPTQISNLSRSLQSLGMQMLIQLMLKWRDAIEVLIMDFNKDNALPSVNSFRWTMMLHHRIIPTGDKEELLKSPSKVRLEKIEHYYVVELGGYEIAYMWQYVGLPKEIYVHPFTSHGIFALAHAFMTHKGVLCTGPSVDTRSSNTSTLCGVLGVAEERCYVNWRTSHQTLMPHVTGASLAGVWLTIVIDASAHVQVLSVLAQELSGFLNTKRIGKRAAAAEEFQQTQDKVSEPPVFEKGKASKKSLNTVANRCSSAQTGKVLNRKHRSSNLAASYITLQCCPNLLQDQQLPLHLLNSFRPYAMPKPSIPALCEMYLLAGGFFFEHTRTLAASAALLWRFIEEYGLGDALTHGHAANGHTGHGLVGRKTGSHLAHLRVLCELTARIAQQLRKKKRTSGRRFSLAAHMQQHHANTMDTEHAHAATLDPTDLPEAPVWARASLYRAFRCLYIGVSPDSNHALWQARGLLGIGDPDAEETQGAWEMLKIEDLTTTSFKQCGLVPVEKQLCATIQMHLWLRLSNQIGPQARGVILLGGIAMGKSSCVNALLHLWSSQGEFWQTRRLNTASLALDAADFLHRPIDSVGGVSPPVTDSGVLEGFEKKRKDHSDVGPFQPSKAARSSAFDLGNGFLGYDSANLGRRVLVHVDGEIGPSIQSAFVAALNDTMPPTGSITRKSGLYLSDHSWIALDAEGPSLTVDSSGTLAFAFEMSADASRSLGPDLVTRCGIQYIGNGVDSEDERKVIVTGLVHKVRKQFGDPIAEYLQDLCVTVLDPLIMLLYGDTPSDYVALNDDGVRSSTSEQKKAARRSRPVTKEDLAQLVGNRLLPNMSRRLALLHFSNAFLALFDDWYKKSTARLTNKYMHQQPKQAQKADIHEHGAPEANSTAANVAKTNLTGAAIGKVSVQTSPKNTKASLQPSLKRETSMKDRENVTASVTFGEHSSATESDLRRASSHERSMSREVSEKPSEKLGISKSHAAKMRKVLAELGVGDAKTETHTAFVFAVAWGLAPLINESAYPAFENVLLHLFENRGDNSALPSEYSVFDAIPVESLKHFTHIDGVLKQAEAADLDAYCYVPTLSGRRFLALTNVLTRSKTHMAILGPPNSGKSSVLGKFISQLPLHSSPSALPLSCSLYGGLSAKQKPEFGSSVELRYLSVCPWTPLGRWERVLQKPLVHSSQQSVRPSLGVWCVYVVDDCHCGPSPLAESWRFAAERGLMHIPGASAAPPRASTRPAEKGGGAAGRRVAERLEREPLPPGVRSFEGVMMVLSARSGTAFCTEDRLLRHIFLYAMSPVSETDMLTIIGDNVSHFVYVNDLPNEIASRNMLYVRLIHGYMKMLSKKAAAPELITLHVLFRFFKSLLCMSTEFLCDLKPVDFHGLLMHELIRETIDRLPVGTVRNTIMKELAELQLDMFGGVADDKLAGVGSGNEVGEDGYSSGSDFGTGQAGESAYSAERVGEVCGVLQSLQYSFLRSSSSFTPGSKSNSQYQRAVDVKAEYTECGSEFATFCAAVKHELTRKWHKHNYVSPLTALMSPASMQKISRTNLMGFVQEDLPGWDPHHTIINEDFCRMLLVFSRLIHHARQKGPQFWGRYGGKTLLVAPSVPIAVAMLRALAHSCRLGIELPNDLSTGLEGPTKFAEVPSPDSLRTWVKERFLFAVTERVETLLVLPPSLLERRELLAVLHEAFAYEGPPEEWYTERERRDCEQAMLALEQKRMHVLDDEGGPSVLERFWFEALSHTHIVLLADAKQQSNHLSTCRYFGIQELNMYVPAMLQQLAVVQQAPLNMHGLIGIARFHLEGPLIDFDSWQPETPLKMQINSETVACVAARIYRCIESANRNAPPHCGLAPAPARLPQGLLRPGPTAGATEAVLPSLAPSASPWIGEGADLGLSVQPFQPIGDILDFLTLAQSLCTIKGVELGTRYHLVRDASLLLQSVHDNVQDGNSDDVEANLASATSQLEEAETRAVEHEKEYDEHQHALTVLTNEVITAHDSVLQDLEETENAMFQAGKDLEVSRITLVNFTKQEQTELKNLLRVNCPPGGDLGELPRTPPLVLFELCCIALKIAIKPTREDIRTTLGDALFTTKLAAIDVESLTPEHIEAMENTIQETDRSEFNETRSLNMIAGMIFPLNAVATSKAKLPILQSESERLSEQREERASEIEEARHKSVQMEREKKSLQVKVVTLQSEVRQCHEWLQTHNERIGRAFRFMSQAADERIRWEHEIIDLSEKLKALVGDCLLSAASAMYLGPHGRGHREQLLAHWREVLKQANIYSSFNAGTDLCKHWLPATMRHRWLVDHELPPDPHLMESMVLAMLQSSTWPLMYDPDGIAVDFLMSWFPKATRISMGAHDFHEKLLAALIASGGDKAREEDMMNSALSGNILYSPENAKVIIVENTHIDALREVDVLMELLPRYRIQNGGVTLYLGAEDLISVHAQQMIIFVTRMGEPFSKSLLTANLGPIDFRLCGGGEPPHDFFLDTLFKNHNTSAFCEWQHLLQDRAAMVDEWRKIDNQLCVLVAPKLLNGEQSPDLFETEDIVSAFTVVKAELTKVEKKILANRKAEQRNAHARNALDPLATSLCSIAQSCERMRWHCPHSNFSIASLRQILAKLVPGQQESGGRQPMASEHGSEADWAATVRTEVVSNLWSKCHWGLPDYLRLSAAVHLAISSAIPHSTLRELFARVLLQCPLIDRSLLNMEIPESCLLATSEPNSRPRALFRGASLMKPSMSDHRSSKMFMHASSGSSLSLGSSGTQVKQRLPPVLLEEDSDVSAAVSPGVERADRQGEAPAVSRPSSAVKAGTKKLDVNMKPSLSPKSTPGAKPDGASCMAQMFVCNDLWGATPPQQIFLARAVYFLGVTRLVIQQAEAAESTEPKVTQEDEEYESDTDESASERGSPPLLSQGSKSRFAATASREVLARDAREEERMARDAIAALPTLVQVKRVLPIEKLPHDFEILKLKMSRQQLVDPTSNQAAPPADGAKADGNEDGKSSGAATRRKSRAVISRMASAEALGDHEPHVDGEERQFLAFLFTYLSGVNLAGELNVNVEWTALMALLDRLQESVSANTDKWLNWADLIAAGELRRWPGSDDVENVDDSFHEDGRSSLPAKSKNSMKDTSPLLQLLPDELMLVLFPQSMPANSNKQDLLQISALVQIVLLIVLLCHSLPALLAGAEAFVDTHLNECSLATSGDALKSVVKNTSHIQPVICLCEGAACHTYEAIQSLAEADSRAPRKIVPITVSGIVASGTGNAQSSVLASAAQSASAVYDLLEEARDVGHWVVMHVLLAGAPSCGGGDMQGGLHPDIWDTFELLERCWIFAAGLAEASTDDKFKLFVVTDFRAARYLPRWLFDSKATCLFDGQSGSQLRPWLERVVRDMKPLTFERTHSKHQHQHQHQGALSRHHSSNLTHQSQEDASLVPPSPKAKSKKSAAAGVAGKVDTSALGRRVVRSSVSVVRDTEVSMATLFRESLLQLTSKHNANFRAEESAILMSPSFNVNNAAQLGATALRILLQIMLSCIAGSEHSVVGSLELLTDTPTISARDGAMADEYLQVLLNRVLKKGGVGAVRKIRLADLLEPIAVVVLRQGSGNHSARGAMHGTVSPRVLHAFMNTVRAVWFSSAKGAGKPDEYACLVGDSARTSAGSVGTLSGGAIKFGFARSSGIKEAFMEEEGEDTSAAEAHVVPMTRNNTKAKDRSTLRANFIDAIENLWNSRSHAHPETTQPHDTTAIDDEHEPLCDDTIMKAVRAFPYQDYRTQLHFAAADRAVLLMVVPFMSPYRTELTLPSIAKAPTRKTKIKKGALVRVSDGVQGDTDVGETKKNTAMLVPSPNNSTVEEWELSLPVHSDLRERSINRQDLAEMFIATITCIETSPLKVSQNIEEEIEEEMERTGSERAEDRISHSPDPEDSWAAEAIKKPTVQLEVKWREQRHELIFWAATILAEAKEFLSGLSEGSETLSERLTLKLRHLLYSYELTADKNYPAQIESLSLPPFLTSTCPPFVITIAETELARTLPPPAGWNHPGFSPKLCFGQWLRFLAFRLHEVYHTEEVPLELPVCGVTNIESLLTSLRIELASRLRLTIDRTCLVFEALDTSLRPRCWDTLNEKSPPSLITAYADVKRAVSRDESGAVSRDESSEQSSSRPSTVPDQMTPSSASPRQNSPGDDQTISKTLSKGETFSQSRERRKSVDRRKSFVDHGRRKSVAKHMNFQGDEVSFKRSSLEKRMSSGEPKSGLSESSKRNSTEMASKKPIASQRKSLSRGLSNIVKDGKRRKSSYKVGARSKPLPKEFGSEKLVLTDLLCDGAVWSNPNGLYVHRSIRGLTRLPPLQVRAMTPRAAEYHLHSKYPQTNGCLELPLRRMLANPTLARGAVQSYLEAVDLTTIRLPFRWGNAASEWHPVNLLDSPPPAQPEDVLNNWLEKPAAEGANRISDIVRLANGSGGDDDTAVVAAATVQRPQLEARLRAPMSMPCPFGLHPAALTLLSPNAAATGSAKRAAGG